MTLYAANHGNHMYYVKTQHSDITAEYKRQILYTAELSSIVHNEVTVNETVMPTQDHIDQLNKQRYTVTTDEYIKKDCHEFIDKLQKRNYAWI